MSVIFACKFPFRCFRHLLWPWWETRRATSGSASCLQYAWFGLIQSYPRDPSDPPITVRNQSVAALTFDHNVFNDGILNIFLINAFKQMNCIDVYSQLPRLMASFSLFSIKHLNFNWYLKNKKPSKAYVFQSLIRAVGLNTNVFIVIQFNATQIVPKRRQFLEQRFLPLMVLIHILIMWLICLANFKQAQEPRTSEICSIELNFNLFPFK